MDGSTRGRPDGDGAAAAAAAGGGAVGGLLASLERRSEEGCPRGEAPGGEAEGGEALVGERESGERCCGVAPAPPAPEPPPALPPPVPMPSPLAPLGPPLRPPLALPPGLLPPAPGPPRLLVEPWLWSERLEPPTAPRSPLDGCAPKAGGVLDGRREPDALLPPPPPPAPPLPVAEPVPEARGWLPVPLGCRAGGAPGLGGPVGSPRPLAAEGCCDRPPGGVAAPDARRDAPPLPAPAGGCDAAAAPPEPVRAAGPLMPLAWLDRRLGRAPPAAGAGCDGAAAVIVVWDGTRRGGGLGLLSDSSARPRRGGGGAAPPRGGPRSGDVSVPVVSPAVSMRPRRGGGAPPPLPRPRAEGGGAKPTRLGVLRRGLTGGPRLGPGLAGLPRPPGDGGAGPAADMGRRGAGAPPALDRGGGEGPGAAERGRCGCDGVVGRCRVGVELPPRPAPGDRSRRSTLLVNPCTAGESSRLPPPAAPPRPGVRPAPPRTGPWGPHMDLGVLDPNTYFRLSPGALGSGSSGPVGARPAREALRGRGGVTAAAAPRAPPPPPGRGERGERFRRPGETESRFGDTARLTGRLGGCSTYQGVREDSTASSFLSCRQQEVCGPCDDWQAGVQMLV